MLRWDAKKVKAQLVEIYTDFLELIGSESSLYEMKSFICEFSAHFYDKSKRFYAVLPIVPREGEAMHFQFLRPILQVPIPFM